MQKINENGKWLIEDKIELLIEPSQNWINIYQPLPTQDEILEQQRQTIINQLYSLDKIINRTQEQLIQDNNLICTHQPILDAIAEKEALREQLRLLV